MKKILFGLSAFTMLFATSCQKDVAFDTNVEESAVVSFNIDTPDLATRAYSDGTTATVLQYAVYNEAGQLLADLAGTTTINTTAKVELQLTTGNKYSVIFWAAAEDAPYSVDFATKTMTVDYTNAVSNDEARDAFYKYYTFTVKGAQTETIELRRPFAQLNIGTADYAASTAAGYTPTQSAVTVKNVYSTLDLVEGNVSTEVAAEFALADIKKDETFPVADNEYLAMNYLLVAADKDVVDIEFTYTDGSNAKTRTVGSVPVQRNYRTNIYGNLLTSDVEINVEIKPEYNEPAHDGSLKYVVANGGEVTLTADVVLDAPLTVKAGKVAVIDLNGHTLSATSENTGANYNMIDVRGTLTVKNGTMLYEHTGANMGWNNSTNLFNVTAGGVLNLEGVTATNLGGSDMAFVAHLNNWGKVTLNVENSTLESTYVPVRVFNSGPDMNNVTIENSTLKGGSYAFWVHNYTAEDFGTEAKAEAQKALLNLNIYNQGNTFSPDVNGIRYGFTNSVKSDAYGITKSVSDDGTEVTLGSVVEDGLIRRGVAGEEENTTIKKAVVGEGVTTLYDRTFRRFYALETVELPSTLTTIGASGSGVFQSCTALKNIVIPESVTVLGKGTFQECSSLESINIPAGVTRIEENCLRATGLVSVEFHAGVTYFGAQALRDCKQLKEVYINAPEFTIEPNAFGVMSGVLPGTTIYVANAEMKAYLESTLAYKNQFTIIAPKVVESTEAFINAVNNVEEGGIITLSSNVTFTTENRTHNSGSWYDGIYYVGDKSFTIDLGGKTIDNANGAVNDYLLNFKNDGTKPCTITIKNGTIDAGTAAYCAICTSSTSAKKITINLENVNVINNNSNGSTIKIRGGAELNVKSGTKITGKNSYLGIECVASTVNIYDGAEIYMNDTSSYLGCLVGACGNGVVNVYGGYGKSAKGGFVAMTSGGTINVAGGEWIANTDGTVGNNSNVYVLTAQNNKNESGWCAPSIINVTGGTLRGGMDAWVLNDVTVEKAELNISGGNFNANPENYKADGATVTENNGIWTVVK